MSQDDSHEMDEELPVWYEGDQSGPSQPLTGVHAKHAAPCFHLGVVISISDSERSGAAR